MNFIRTESGTGLQDREGDNAGAQAAEELRNLLYPFDLTGRCPAWVLFSPVRE
ncbi:hypothetical protein SynMEDNS5_01156 [Synechococcus sp. MEDNS5]|nr:hypothetical protein SynMEDNS5_01156 [Synechococcus sp. MEDNS5]